MIIEGSAPTGGRSNIKVLYKRVSYQIAPGPLVPYSKKGRRDEFAGDETYYKGCRWGGTCGSGTVKVMLQLQSYGYEVAEKLASVVETQYP